VNPALLARGVEKRFPVRRGLRAALRAPFARETRVALGGVDLEVRPGELVGLLGPNGAGKTTLTRLFASLLLPDSGTVEVAGVDVAQRPRAARAAVGLALGEDRGLQLRLSGRENLRFFSALYDLPSAETRARVDELTLRLELGEVIDRPVRTYSSGERARVALARALLHRPRVLLLDEVTRALDPGAAARVRLLLRRELVERDGLAVLLTSHDLHEVQQVCDRVVLMERGRVRAQGAYSSVEPDIRQVFALTEAA
jgi:ABC-2 type transport system ATP-binding protein